MTLKEQIEDDRAGVFLNTDDFAVSVTHYPGGEEGGPQSIFDAQLFIDEAQSGNNLGGNALDGDGLVPFNERGVSERQSAILEMPAEEEVVEVQGYEPSSLFIVTQTVNGVETKESWRAVRIVGRDFSIQSVLVVFVDRHVTRKAMRQ